MEGAAGWAGLPLEILLTISNLLALPDIVRLRAVCMWWARALGSSRWFPRPSPWMLLPNAAGEETDACTFLDLTGGRRYTISSLPQITGRRFFGSSPDGWLVTVDLLLTPRLLNPLTREEISLPSLATSTNKVTPLYSPEDGSLSGFCYDNEADPYSIQVFRDDLLRKIILTSSPLRGGIAIAVCAMDFFWSFLTFARVGDDTWAPGPNIGDDVFEDVVYNEADDKLYAVTNLGGVFTLEYNSLSSSWEVVSKVAPPIEKCYLDHRRRYIIFAAGELLQITKDIHYTQIQKKVFKINSTAFNIFRFEPDCFQNQHEPQQQKNGGKAETCCFCWTPVNDLKDRLIFLGSNHSFSLPASDEIGLKKNQIFFTDDLCYSWIRENTVYDVGVFNLENNSIEFLFPSDCQVNLPPPIFLMPNSVSNSYFLLIVK